MSKPRRRNFRPALNALEGRQLLSGASASLSPPVTFQFGPAGQSVPAGTIAVNNSTFYSAGQGYGFTALQNNTNTTGDAVYSGDMTFQVDLPDGTYAVTPTVGDSGGGAHAAKVFVQGAEEATVASGAGQNASPSYLATVSNGHLTLELRGTSSDPLAYIQGLSVVPRSLQYQFGPQGQTTPAGTTAVSNYTNYNAGQGYGFTALQNNTNVTNDAVYSGNMTFQVDLPNGTYTVTPALGDSGSGAHTNNVFVQGTELTTLRLAPGQLVSPSYQAIVTDGHLTLQLQGVQEAGTDGLALIRALSISPSSSTVIDNIYGGAFSEAGAAWGKASGYGGYNNAVDFAGPGDGTTTATWQAPNLASGNYDVEVSWLPGTNRATNAPYQIYDGNTLLATVHVNQQAPPTGTIIGGAAFQSLGTYHVSNGSLRVQLANNANGYVIADAVSVAPSTTGPVSIDNAGAGFAEAGAWTQASGYGGVGNEVDFAAPGDGSTTATWQTPGLNPGSYDVQVTWMPGSNRATNAAYQVYDGNNLLGTVKVNQQQSPSGPYVGGVAYQSLGVFNIKSGTVRVVLSNNANGYVIADAARVTLPTITSDNAGPNFSQAGFWTQAPGYGGMGNEVDFAAPGDGSITSTWTTPNLASANYDVQVSWTAGTNRATNAPYQIYDGNTLLATVTVNQQAAPVGAVAGGVAYQSLGVFHVDSGTLRVVLSNNANGYVIADAERVTPPTASPLIVDNTDSGFAETGLWVHATGYGGVNNQIDYAAPGNGSSVATWQTPGLNPGRYDVQVTWVAGTNRATNATYQIYDGNTLLASVPVNQQVAPSDVTVGGFGFKSLGVYNLTGGNLRVVLSNNANGYVVADALRVAPVTV